MIYCRFEWTWEKLKIRQTSYLSEISKRINKTRKILRYFEELIILVGGMYLIFSKNIIAKVFGYIFIGFIVLYFIYHIFLKFIISKKKFNNVLKKIGGKWYIELWVDQNIIVKNIDGRGEVRTILFSEIEEYGDTEEECYIVFKNQTFRFPKNSFIEGNWKSMVEKIEDSKNKK